MELEMQNVEKTSSSTAQGGAGLNDGGELPTAAAFSSSSSPSSHARAGVLEGHTRWVRCVFASADGAHAYSGSRDDVVRVWDLQTHRCVARLEGHISDVNAITESRDGKYIVSGSGVVMSFAPNRGLAANSIKIWNTATRECVATLEGHSNFVSALALTGDSKHLFSASRDNAVRVWSMRSHDCIATITAHSKGVGCLHLCQGDTHCVTGGGDYLAKVWRINASRASLACIATLKGHTAYVNAVCTARDDACIVTGSGDKRIRLWRSPWRPKSEDSEDADASVTPATGGAAPAAKGGSGEEPEAAAAEVEAEAVLKGHHGPVTGVAVVPSTQTHIVSSSDDKTVKVWCLSTRACLATLQGHTSTVFCVAMTRDSGHIISGSADGTVRVWASPFEALTLTKDDPERALMLAKKGMFPYVDVPEIRRRLEPSVLHLIDSDPPLALRLAIGKTLPYTQEEAVQARLLPHVLDLVSEDAPRAISLAQSGKLPYSNLPQVQTAVFKAAIGTDISLALDIANDMLVLPPSQRFRRYEARARLRPGDFVVAPPELLLKREAFATFLDGYEQQDAPLVRLQVLDLDMQALCGVPQSQWSRWWRRFVLYLTDRRAAHRPRGSAGSAGEERGRASDGGAPEQQQQQSGAEGMASNPQLGTAPVSHGRRLAWGPSAGGANREVTQGQWKAGGNQHEARRQTAPSLTAVAADDDDGGGGGGGIDSSMSLFSSLVASGRSELFGYLPLRAAVQLRWQTSGRIAFVVETVLHVILLALLVTVSLSSRHWPSELSVGGGAGSSDGSRALDGVVYVILSLSTIGGMDEVYQVFHHGRRHFTNLWNWLDLGRISLTLGFGAMYLLRHEATRTVLGFTVVLQWVACLYFLLPFRRTGPLVLMLLQILQDTFVFLFILFVVVLGATNSMYVFLHDAQADGFSDFGFALFTTTTMLLFGGYDEGLFDKGTDPLSLRIVFVAVMFLVLVILLNLLIAILSDSYERVQDRSAKELTMAKAKVLYSQEASFFLWLRRFLASVFGLALLIPLLLVHFLTFGLAERALADAVWRAFGRPGDGVCMSMRDAAKLLLVTAPARVGSWPPRAVVLIPGSASQLAEEQGEWHGMLRDIKTRVATAETRVQSKVEDMGQGVDAKVSRVERDVGELRQAMHQLDAKLNRLLQLHDK